MTIESDFIEPEYEAAADDAPHGSLPRRVAQIIFYGGSAAALGLMLLVYASPAFASRVGDSLPQGLVEFAAGDSGGCPMSGGCPQKTASASTCEAAEWTAASDGTLLIGKPTDPADSPNHRKAAGCCSSLSRAALLTTADDAAPEESESL